MQKITFKDVPRGAYFRAAHAECVTPTFVKRGDYPDEAYPIGEDGLAIDEGPSYEFEPDQEVEWLDCESEWPTIDYAARVREEWKWDKIVFDASNNFYYDKYEDVEDPIGRAFMGTTLGVMPSGKIYAFWTSNQTAEDVNRDEAYSQALCKVAEEHSLWIDWRDGDCFACKSTTWEEVGRGAGYKVLEEGGGYYWVDETLDSDMSDFFDDEEEAWKDCCLRNRLVEG